MLTKISQSVVVVAARTSWFRFAYIFSRCASHAIETKYKITLNYRM